MANCNVEIHSISNALVTWEPLAGLQITGFANSELSVEIAPSDEGDNKLMVAADGLSGTVSVNGKTNGEVTLKLFPGSPYVGVLNQIWHADKVSGTLSVGELVVANLQTGKTDALGCAHLKNVPTTGEGSEVPESYDFVFNYVRREYVPSSNSLNAIRQGAQ